MRKPLAILALAFVLASCGDSGDQRRGQASQSMSVGHVSEPTAAPAPPQPGRMQTFDAAERPAGPNVNPTAAPGVAFNYGYAFRLDAARIAAVQERHAAACEQLGISRCRITGMLYRVRSETDIEARLQFALDPAVARAFGRHSVGVVSENGGMLVESQITGTDAGGQVRRVGRSIADLEGDLARVEQRLGATGLSRGDRERIEHEAQQLRQTIRAARQTREDAAETLATTPMSFVYGSGDLVPGFAEDRPIGDALDQAGKNLLGGIAVLLVILVTLLPWLAVALLGWLAYRGVRRRWERQGAAAVGPAA
ncbi:MAG TPA: hypothetical protein VEZ20_01190 [Allosphingosinicella sp.]|jgi:hypothetical protein|nr:hypothetical protein [Allosphingosinicella sp.]